MKKETGFSLIELLVVVTIMGVLAALAVPSLLSARRSANEGSAIATLRTVFNAEMTHQATAGSGNFAGSLSALREAYLIDETVASGTKAGFRFSGGKTDYTLDRPATIFYSAIPSSPSGPYQTGTRKFGIATDGVLRATASNLISHFTGETDVMSTAPFSN